MTVIRPNSISGINSITAKNTDQMKLYDSNGAWSHVRAGVITATKFVGPLTGSTGTFTSNVTIDGNLGVGGVITYEDVARVDAVGLSTFREGFGVGPLSGIALTAYKDGSIRTSGIITAASFVGDGSGLTGAGPTLANGSNDRLVTATGANALNAEANLTYNGSSQLKLSGAGQQDFIIGSTNASGSYLILDGDSNGDAIGADYAYIAHDTGGDVIIGGDNPNGDAAIIFKVGNNDEKLRIDSSGRLLINKTAGTGAGYGTQNKLQIEGTDAASSSIQIKRNSNDTNGPYLYLGKSRGTSIDSDTVVQNGDEVGSIVYHGTDGTDANNVCAKIVGAIDGAPGSNDMPGRLVFMTTADGAGDATERMRIDKNGYVTKPYTPHFNCNSTPTIGNSSELYVARSFGNVNANVGSHYNNSNGRFTAPIAGTYLFGSGLWCSNNDQNSGLHLLVFRKNGAEAGFGCNHRIQQNQLHATMCVVLAANDHVTTGFASGSGGSIQGSTPRNYFWGYLVG